MRRIGQSSSVTSIWMQANELDKHVDSMLQRKQNNVDEVISMSSTGSSIPSNTNSPNECGSGSSGIAALVQQVLPKLFGDSLVIQCKTNANEIDEYIQERGERNNCTQAGAGQVRKTGKKADPEDTFMSPEAARQYGGKRRQRGKNGLVSPL